MGVGVPGCLALSGGVSFGDLALFAACGSFRYGGSFGAACGFDTLGSCGASGVFSLKQGRGAWRSQHLRPDGVRAASAA